MIDAFNGIKTFCYFKMYLKDENMKFTLIFFPFIGSSH